MNRYKIITTLTAHCGIQDNEEADILAKKGSKIMEKGKQKFSDKNYNFDLIDTNKNLKWIKFLKTPGIIPEVPRKSAVAIFRLLVVVGFYDTF